MESYKNEQKLIEDIMHRDSPEFLIGRTGEKRARFLQDMSERYPFKCGKNPIGIYVPEFGLLPVKNRLDRYYHEEALHLSQDYLNASIIDATLKAKMGFINQRTIAKALALRVSEYSFKKGTAKKDIKDYDTLTGLIKDTKDYSKKSFQTFLETGEMPNPCGVVLTCINIKSFFSIIGESLSRPLHFVLLFDKCEDISKYSTTAMNAFIGFSQSFTGYETTFVPKIAVAANEWEHYYPSDYKEQHLQPILEGDEYIVTSLDDSSDVYMKKKIREQEELVRLVDRLAQL